MANPGVPNPKMGRTRRVKELTRLKRVAFDYWVALGDARTISDVSRDLNIDESTLQSWANADDWAKQVAESDRVSARLTALRRKQAHEAAIEREVQYAARLFTAAGERLLQLLPAMNPTEALKVFEATIRLERLANDLSLQPDVPSSQSVNVSTTLQLSAAPNELTERERKYEQVFAELERSRTAIVDTTAQVVDRLAASDTPRTDS